ncbi:MAG: glycosyltransferase family 4 protein [Pseudomonadota bacterium]
MTEPTLAVVVKGWPRLSETFIAQELVALEQAGLQFDVWSLRFPYDKKTHPLHQKLKARVRYLPEYLHNEPARVVRAWRAARRLPGYAKARALWLADLKRDITRNRVRRFGQACVMAVEAPSVTRGIYAHFLHTPSSVARYAAVMLGIPWSFSAHAKDIWTTPEWDLAAKLSDAEDAAQFGVTCTGVGARFLKDRSADQNTVSLVYHGLDLSRFPAPPDRSRVRGQFHMLSVGRLVEKKGFDVLLSAFQMLPDNLDWHWVHIGGGDLSEPLQAQAKSAGLADRITWVGKADQPEVIEAMRAADLFVLPSRIAQDGDRDGLPNVLMEAASQKLPILSTPVSAIPEFIDSGTHGLLVEGTPPDLAAGIEKLASDPELQRQFSEAAYDRLVAEFSMEGGLATLRARLAGLLEQG